MPTLRRLPLLLPPEPAHRRERIVVDALLLARTIPHHARKTLEWHQRLAGVSPLLQLLDADVVDRLAAGAALEQCARDVDHVLRARPLVIQRRAARGAEIPHAAVGLVLEASDQRLALEQTKALLPDADIGRVG